MARHRLPGIILASLVSVAAVSLGAFLASRLGSEQAAHKGIAYRLVPTFTVLPKGVYDDQFNDPDAEGTIRVVPPDAASDVALDVCVQGLLADTLYIVKIDTNGNGAAYDSPGPWTQAGEFRTDSEGRAQWQFRPPPGAYPPGPHTWSLYINLAEAQRSILISEDIPIEVAPRDGAKRW